MFNWTISIDLNVDIRILHLISINPGVNQTQMSFMGLASWRGTGYWMRKEFTIQQ